MRQKIITLTLSFFFAGSSFGQEFEQIKDSLEIERFYSFVDSIFKLKRDISLPDSLNNYAFVYKTSCRNDEVLYSDRILYTTEGKSFINDSLSYKTHECSLTYPIKKIAPYYCAEKPSKLMERVAVNVYVQTIVTVDSLVFETIRISNNLFEYEAYGLTKFSSYCSFQNGKYLIIEFFLTTRIGSQTSPGITETLFLERIE
ncbi:MAG: hypothetical protein U9R42_06020 [Bacteroidota bacterium]|nr:hypothetical protein [Bacteroidota bacterium]